MHDIGLILTVTAGLSVAVVFGYITHRLGASPILGYLLAGMAIGPFTPGYVADGKSATQLAEIGVILLMFGVGLHFHLADLLAVRRIALPGAVFQIAVATAMGTGLAIVFGWGLLGGLVLGVAISVASTVVLMRGLMDANMLGNVHGHIAVGWLVVEDIFTVLAIVALPSVALMASGEASGWSLAGQFGWAVLKLVFLVVLLLGIGKRVLPMVLAQVAKTRSRELFTLAVLSLALAIATASAVLFDASMALGAFLAGMVVGQSNLSHQAAADALPMRDAFAVLFFVSVGMLFDPSVLIKAPGMVGGVLAIVLIGKPLAAMVLVLALGWSVKTALVVAIALSQIGEFSFILAEEALSLGLLTEGSMSIIVACAILSIAANPFLFRLVSPIERWLQSNPRLWAIVNRRAEARGAELNTSAGHALASSTAAVRAVVVGYGPVGQTVVRLLREFDIQPVIVDMNIDTVRRLQAEGLHAVFGDASRRDILEAAGLGESAYLVLTLPDPESRTPIILTARAINPSIQVLVRARFLRERENLESLGPTVVCYEEAEAAVALARGLLRQVGAPEERVRAEGDRVRGEFELSGAGMETRLAVAKFDGTTGPEPPSS